nr:hypothetical protein [uncultured Holophaga sp.]
MSWTSGTATDYLDLLNRLNAFLLLGHSLPPVYTGTGTGTIEGLIGTAASVQETLTVTLTSDSAFSVSGSVSGDLGTGTVGTAFSCSVAAFTLTAGDTAWVSGDTVAFVMTRPWEAVRASASDEYIWKAPGNTGEQAIYVGAKKFQNDTGAYWNWRLMGATGFSSSAAFTTQPGVDCYSFLPLWNAAIPYWFVSSGKSVRVIAKISTQYEQCYLGFIDSYASPGGYPYPLLVGGAMGFTSTTYTATSSVFRYGISDDTHKAWWFPGGDSGTTYTTGRFRLISGTWKNMAGKYTSGAADDGLLHTWPYMHYGLAQNMRTNLDGSVPLLPIQLNDSSATFGEPEGMAFLTGYYQSAENTLTVGRTAWLVVPNISRAGVLDYVAYRLA